jgi:hypothetical protein
MSIWLYWTKTIRFYGTKGALKTNIYQLVLDHLNFYP